LLLSNKMMRQLTLKCAVLCLFSFIGYTDTVKVKF